MLGSSFCVYGHFNFGSVLRLSVVEQTCFGSSMSLRSNSLLASALSISDSLALASSLSIRHFVRAGSAVSIVGTGRVSKSCVSLVASMDIAPSMSIRGLRMACGARGSRASSVLDATYLGSTLSVRSFARFGLCCSVVDCS